eukprot:scaffold11901_cov96-Isochrysis_galbana.AAC.2
MSPVPRQRAAAAAATGYARPVPPTRIPRADAQVQGPDDRLLLKPRLPQGHHLPGQLPGRAALCHTVFRALRLGEAE